MAPGTYILHASKSSSIELSDKFHVNPVETSCKIDEKPQYDRILVRFEVKMDPKYYPGGPIFYTFLNVVTESFKAYSKWI